MQDKAASEPAVVELDQWYYLDPAGKVQVNLNSNYIAAQNSCLRIFLSFLPLCTGEISNEQTI